MNFCYKQARTFTNPIFEVLDHFFVVLKNMKNSSQTFNYEYIYTLLPYLSLIHQLSILALLLNFKTGEPLSTAYQFCTSAAAQFLRWQDPDIN